MVRSVRAACESVISLRLLPGFLHSLFKISPYRFLVFRIPDYQHMPLDLLETRPPPSRSGAGSAQRKIVALLPRGMRMAAPPVAMLVPQKLERRFMQAATDFLKTTELRAEADLPEKVECGSITIFRRGFAISVPARDETMAPLGCHERDRSLPEIERWMRRRVRLKRTLPKRQVRPRVPPRMRQGACRERPARNRPLSVRAAPRTAIPS